MARHSSAASGSRRRTVICEDNNTIHNEQHEMSQVQGKAAAKSHAKQQTDGSDAQHGAKRAAEQRRSCTQQRKPLKTTQRTFGEGVADELCQLQDAQLVGAAVLLCAWHTRRMRTRATAQEIRASTTMGQSMTQQPSAVKRPTRREQRRLNASQTSRNSARQDDGKSDKANRKARLTRTTAGTSLSTSSNTSRAGCSSSASARQRCSRARTADSCVACETNQRGVSEACELQDRCADDKRQCGDQSERPLHKANSSEENGQPPVNQNEQTKQNQDRTFSVTSSGQAIHTVWASTAGECRACRASAAARAVLPASAHESKRRTGGD